MFTGIIMGKGRVETIAIQGEKCRLTLETGELAQKIRIGDSVAVSGVCLTAVEINKTILAFDVVTTTLQRSTLAQLSRGHFVNLEPALSLGDPLGGHLVSGHVDGIGTIRSLKESPGECRFRIDAPKEVLEFLVERGSVAVAGISLTIAHLHDDGFEIAVIPHTLSETTLSAARPGDKVNLEGDMIGRFVAKYLKQMAGGKQGLTVEKLREEGY